VQNVEATVGNVVFNRGAGVAHRLPRCSTNTKIVAAATTATLPIVTTDKARSSQYGTIINFLSHSAFAPLPTMTRLNHRCLPAKSVNDSPRRETAGGEFANDSITRNNRVVGSLHLAGRTAGCEPANAASIDLHAKETASQSRGNCSVTHDKLAIPMRMSDHVCHPPHTLSRRNDDLCWTAFKKHNLKIWIDQHTFSHKPSSPGNYAPKVFAVEAEAKTANLRKAELEDAMRRLFANGKIVVEPYGKASNQHERIGVKNA
jgi:hypothetical protein